MFIGCICIIGICIRILMCILFYDIFLVGSGVRSVGLWVSVGVHLIGSLRM